jgi:hypothetical protein
VLHGDNPVARDGHTELEQCLPVRQVKQLHRRQVVHLVAVQVEETSGCLRGLALIEGEPDGFHGLLCWPSSGAV